MYKIEEFMGKRVLKSSLINDDNIVAFFTTRDLALKCGEREDLKEEIENNKKLVCKGLNIPTENLIIPQQTHSDNVVIIKGKAKGEKEKEGKRAGRQEVKLNFASQNFKPINSSPNHPINSSTFRLFDCSTFENTDALITNQPQIALALNFADCVPIILIDKEKKIIASVHAGWRGTVAQIGVKTVEKMVKEFGCEPENIIALIGPAIGKCCFEAGEEVIEKLKVSVYNQCPEVFSNKHADLKLVNCLQLLSCGLKKIDVCEYCTSCQIELFFSYRKEKGNTARHSAIIMLKGENK